MCFKRKKKPVLTGYKFELGTNVAFHKKNDLVIGYIYNIKQEENGEFVYDIQIGGECPAIIENVEEKLIIRR